MSQSKLFAVAALLVLTACGDPLVGESPLANYPPTIGALGELVTPEDTPLVDVALAVGDPDGAETVTLTLSSSDESVIPNAGLSSTQAGDQRLISIVPAPDASGEAIITAVASDGALQATTSFLVRVTPVNDAPTLAPIADLTMDEDSVLGPIDIQALDIDSPLADIVLTLSSGDEAIVPNAGLVLSGSEGAYQLTITPAANANGTVTITATVSDGDLSSTLSFTVVVNPVNDAPTIAAIADLLMDEDVASAVITVTVNDIDSPLSALGLEGSAVDEALFAPGAYPVGAYEFGGADGSRTLVLHNVLDANGQSMVSVTVSDGELSATTSFNVTVTGVDDAPTIALVTASPVMTDEDTPTGLIEFTVNDIDSPLNGIVLSGVAADTGLAGPGAFGFSGTDATRTLQITPESHQNGDSLVTVTATSGGGTAATTFDLSVTSLNDPPLIGPIQDASAIQGQGSVDVTVLVSEVVGDDEDSAASLRLEFEYPVPNPSNAECLETAVNGEERSITCTFGSWAGAVTIRARAIDSLDAPSLWEEFTLNVAPSDNPPTISGLPLTASFEEDQSLTLPFSALDTDFIPGATITGAVSWNPPGTLTASLTPTGGVSDPGATTQDFDLILTGLADQNGGPISVVVTVEDSQGNASSHTIAVTVTPVNDAPVASAHNYSTGGNRQLVVDAPGVLTGATDPDGTTPVAVAVTSASTPAGGTISIAADGSFTYRPKPGYTGPDSFSYFVSDGALTSPSATLTFTVGSPVIWFVDSDAVAGGMGTDWSPFSSLSDMVSADDQAGDYIQVACGSDYADQSITLKDNQQLYGALSVPSDGDAADCKPVITLASGDAITLANGNSVSNLEVSVQDGHAILGGAIAGTTRLSGISVVGGVGGSGVSLTGAPGGASTTVAVSELSVADVSGTALLLKDLDSLTVEASDLSANGGRALDIDSVTVGPDGVAFVSVASTASAAGGAYLSNITGELSIGTLTLDTTGDTGLYVDLVDSLVVSTGGISSVDGAAAIIASSALDITLEALSCDGDSDDDGVGVVAVGLELADTTGSFVVLGDAAAVGRDGSGGTIKGVDLGVSLVNAEGVSLSQMDITEGTNGAIVGDGATDFSLIASTLGDPTVAVLNNPAIGAISLLEPAGDTLIDDVGCAAPSSYCVTLDTELVATKAKVTISDSDFGAAGLSAGRGGVRASFGEQSESSLTMTDNTFTALSVGAVKIAMVNTTPSGPAPSPVPDTELTLELSGSTFAGVKSLIDAAVGSQSSLRFNIKNNTGSATGDAIALSFGTGSWYASKGDGFITGNTFGSLAAPPNAAVLAGIRGVALTLNGAGAVVAEVSDNTVTGTSEEAFRFEAIGDGNVTPTDQMDITLKDNVFEGTIATDSTHYAADVRVSEGATMCVGVSGNDFTGVTGVPPVAPDIDMSFVPVSDDQITVAGFDAAGAGMSIMFDDLQTHILDNNTGFGNIQFDNTKTVRTATTCTQPTPWP